MIGLFQEVAASQGAHSIVRKKGRVSNNSLLNTNLDIWRALIKIHIADIL